LSVTYYLRLRHGEWPTRHQAQALKISAFEGNGSKGAASVRETSVRRVGCEDRHV